jgi:hypothetical protein
LIVPKTEPDLDIQGSKLTYVRQSMTDKNPCGHIDFFTYQSDLARTFGLIGVFQNLGEKYKID